ncbi:MAG TPA: EpsI family protein [Terriglobia bacterium]|nr:EpsI family protein [Terriglobia bacterium]
MTEKNKWIRFSLAVVLIGGTAVFLRSRSKAETLAPARPPSEFPLQVGNWKGRDIPIPQWALNVLGDGEFVERSFSRSPNEFPVDFFLAYFPTQRTGSTMHSPQNCLPGAGWTPVEFSRVSLSIPGSGNIRVNRYVIAKGLDRQLVLYWYQAHGRVIPSEYWAKFYLVADAIRLNRSDGALVRFMTPIAQNETVASAEQRAVALIQDVDPLLVQYVPK